MGIAITLEQYLSEHEISYDILRHTPTASSSKTAEVSHISGKRIAKGVLLKDEKGYLLAVLPASSHISFSNLRRILKRSLTLATEEEGKELFQDCETGALPAAGQAYGVPVLLDSTLVEQPEVFFEAGDHVSLLHLSRPEFSKLMYKTMSGEFSQ